MSRFARLAALLPLLLLVGCGQQASRDGPPAPRAALPVLADSEVPGIGSVTRMITAADLAKDAVIPELAARIRSWGYLSGRQRTFQGQSRHLTLVISRALMFRSPAGARNYVTFVRRRESAFFGMGVEARRLAGPGATGWLFTPPLCACHLANPALVSVLDVGARVLWLEINGPAANSRLLLRLTDSVRRAAVRPVG